MVSEENVCYFNPKKMWIPGIIAIATSFFDAFPVIKKGNEKNPKKR